MVYHHIVIHISFQHLYLATQVNSHVTVLSCFLPCKFLSSYLPSLIVPYSYSNNRISTAIIFEIDAPMVYYSTYSKLSFSPPFLHLTTFPVLLFLHIPYFLFYCLLRFLESISLFEPIIDLSLSVQTWTESLKSVIDENRVLTLRTNERIPLKPHIKIGRASCRERVSSPV